jgi:hypothetical protein
VASFFFFNFCIFCKFWPTTRPNQPNNKQNQTNLATSNQKKFMAIFGVVDLVLWWVGIAGVPNAMVGGHCRSHRSIAMVGGRRCGGWQIWGGSRPPLGVAQGHPRAFMSYPRGGMPPEREERWPRAAPYGSGVEVLGGFSSILVAAHFS